MPNIVIRHHAEQKWAQFDKAYGGAWIRWGKMEDATRFESAQEAKEAWEKGIAQMKSCANARWGKAQSAGGRKITTPKNWEERGAYQEAVGKLSDKEKKARIDSKALWDEKKPNVLKNGMTLNEAFRKLGWVLIPAKESDYLPAWFKKARPLFEMTVNKAQDLLGPMEIWFVRSERGWLAARWRYWEGVASLHQAISFFSKEAALSASSAANWKNAALFKAQMLVSQVMPSGNMALDDLSAMVRAGCEAKEIEGGISKAAEERLAAIDSAKKPKGQRL